MKKIEKAFAPKSSNPRKFRALPKKLPEEYCLPLDFFADSLVHSNCCVGMN